MNYKEAYNYIFNEIGQEGLKLLDFVAKDDTLNGIIYIQEITKCDVNTAKLLWVDLKCQFGTEETNPFLKKSTLSPQQQAHNQAVAREALNKPKCQICGSTNIKRISTTEKAVNVAMFGLLGNKRKYQWHCNNCKSDF